jgi:hypothetical protein
VNTQLDNENLGMPGPTLCEVGLTNDSGRTSELYWTLITVSMPSALIVGPATSDTRADLKNFL